MTVSFQSTWEGRPGIWIEDVIVIEEARGRGVGTSLMQCIAAKANKEGCRRVEWMALDWFVFCLSVLRRDSR